MKKIQDIIASELVIRHNNFNLQQEFGEVGNSDSITAEGTSTIFTTKYNIHKVNYVTVNGITLTEGVHYIVTGPNTISISNSGAPVRKNPSITTQILVSYFANNTSVKETLVPPVINSFTLNTYSGREAEIIFNFSISQRDGRNIYWSIIKDGSSTPLYSGNTLYTTNGISNDGTTSVELNYFVSPAEYQERQGTDMPFTLIVIYDLSDDGSYLNEKLMSTAIYHLETTETITGYITAVPEMIQIAGTTPATISYQINYPSTSAILFDWKVTKSRDGGAETTLAEGNQASTSFGGTLTDVINALSGDNFESRYYLRVKETGSSTYEIIANDKIVISVPVPDSLGGAGYLDAAIMSYIDGNGVRRKIGSLGTEQDLVEYTNRVPREIFTKQITEEYLTTNDFITAPVNTFEGTVSSVYFVLEMPDAWGPFDIYQSLGKIDAIAFNRIILGNGYTAYLYNIAPSSVSFPSDYYLKGV